VYVAARKGDRIQRESSCDPAGLERRRGGDQYFPPRPVGKPEPRRLSRANWRSSSTDCGATPPCSQMFSSCSTVKS
jgi:hypothetical protein